MLTPKQLKSIVTIVEEEKATIVAADPTLAKHFTVPADIESQYFKNAVAGTPTFIAPTLKVTTNETVEVLEAKEPRYHTKRLIAVTSFRIALRMVKQNLPIAAKTKDWLQASVGAQDFRVEAEKIAKE